MLNNFEATTLDLHQEQDPRSKLSLLLQHKRFLLVLDNVWSKQDWEFFVCSLPKGLCGSKIIIITRNSDVASFPVKSSEYIHDLSTGLSFKEAHDLFCKKAFQDGICPPELEECSRKILNKCEGSPFAISTVGTVLATKPQTKNEWEELHDTLTSNFTADPKLLVLSRIFQPCYRDLQSHLKSCFLYLGIFPEDYYIRRGRLFRLWVAEGFVEPTAGLTVEEVAEQYLNELIDSNLVQASSWGIDGRVKSCRISNIVRAFIMSQKFVTDSETIWCRQTEVDKVRRLSAPNLIIKYLSNSGIDLNGIRTLQSYKKGSSGLDLNVIRTLQGHKKENSDSQFAMVLKTTRFLRVLDLQGVPLEKFPSSVVGLTLLKYLSLRKSQIKTVPQSIEKLLFLETLDLKYTRVTHLPEEICKLVRLRHLLVCNNPGSGGVTLSAGNLGALSSIQNLSLVKVENDRRILKALGKLIGLRKLGLTDVRKEDGVELCCSLQKMENLSSFDVASTSKDEYLDLDHMQSPLVAPLYLERLFLIGRLERVPKWIPELTSLTKILLKWSRVKPHVNSLEALESLPNLMELTLVQFYTGKKLVFKAQTFKKLMILRIEEFDELNLMKVESQAMPMLKKLIISRCQGLDSLPWGITGLIQLEELIESDMPDKFIANLQKHSAALEMMQIRVIHSSKTGSNQSSTRFQDFSPSNWHLES
ncbi:disease resistance protein RPM1 [Rosa chinensis]|nr:disease resistance protein RPM1 [Rosa chinensis]